MNRILRRNRFARGLALGGAGHEGDVMESLQRRLVRTKDQPSTSSKLCHIAPRGKSRKPQEVFISHDVSPRVYEAPT